MDPAYADWLNGLHPDGTTAGQYLSDLRRVEACYGDMDAAWAEDQLESILASMDYSTVAERNNEPNPSKLPIQGSLYKSLASYRSTVRKYRRFCEDRERAQGVSPGEMTRDACELSFRYEHDLQAALVSSLGQVEHGLQLAQDGVERGVPSGRIDVLAIDAQERYVVIELKAVTAKRDVLGQIAAYMADIEDQTGQRPRGILIAPDFDPKLASGARMIDGLELKRYRFAFTFEDVGVHSNGRL